MTTQATTPAPAAANLTSAERAAALIGLAKDAASKPWDAVVTDLKLWADPRWPEVVQQEIFRGLHAAVQQADGLMNRTTWWTEVYDETEFRGSPDPQEAAIDHACQLVQDTANKLAMGEKS
jgi:hypothetical protein